MAKILIIINPFGAINAIHSTEEIIVEIVSEGPAGTVRMTTPQDSIMSESQIQDLIRVEEDRSKRVIYNKVVNRHTEDADGGPRMYVCIDGLRADQPFAPTPKTHNITRVIDIKRSEICGNTYKWMLINRKVYNDSIQEEHLYLVDNDDNDLCDTLDIIKAEVVSMSRLAQAVDAAYIRITQD